MSKRKLCVSFVLLHFVQEQQQQKKQTRATFKGDSDTKDLYLFNYFVESVCITRAAE